MSQATKAILCHYSSTPEKPQHDYCPKGKESWCSYQRDLVNGTKLHKPIKNPLCPAIVEVVKPVFDRLGDANFLAGCEKCLTQNPNESLHHVTWGLAPKEQYTSPRETSLAVGLGCLLEVTYSQLLPSIGLNVSEEMISAWMKIDKKRSYGADYKERSEIKERRKKHKRQRAKKADAFVHNEGMQYKSQGFYADVTVKEKGKNCKRKHKK